MTLAGRVAPFGHPRIKTCWRFPGAFRSLPRPSSPPGAKASTGYPSKRSISRPQRAHAQGTPRRRRVSPPVAIATSYARTDASASNRSMQPAPTSCQRPLPCKPALPPSGEMDGAGSASDGRCRRLFTNVKEPRPDASAPGKLVFRLSEVCERHAIAASALPPTHRVAGPRGWWSRTGSNRRPPACKAGALPTELRPRPARPAPQGACRPALSCCRREVVGLGRLELPTSRLSGVRSNRLSYRPRKAGTARLRGRPDGASERGREVKAAATGCRRRVTEPPGVRPAETIVTLVFRRSGSRSVRRRIRRCGTIQKGGDPAAGSPTATLLRLHPSR
jgi:hypothetical protein